MAITKSFTAPVKYVLLHRQYAWILSSGFLLQDIGKKGAQVIRTSGLNLKLASQTSNILGALELLKQFCQAFVRVIVLLVRPQHLSSRYLDFSSFFQSEVDVEDVWLDQLVWPRLF